MTPREVRVTLPGHPPGPNVRLSVMERARWNASWRAEARYLAIDVANRLHVSPIERARVTLHFRDFPGVRHDRDNLVAAAKPALDGLVGVLLVDDDADHVVDLRVALERCDRKDLTIIVEAWDSPH